MNKELISITNWLNATKLSINVKYIKYSFFHKTSQNDNMPLRLPNLKKNWLNVERESSIQFLGIWIVGNLTRRDYIHFILKQNCGLLYQRKHYLDERCLKQIYFAHAHTYCTVSLIGIITYKVTLKFLQEAFIFNFP